MTPRPHLWQSALAAISTLLLALVVGCSSPTTPTPPPTTAPPAPATQPLTISCPPPQTAASPDGSPVAVTYPAATTTGGVVGAGGASLATVACTPASASQFSVGATQVRCTATAATETASCIFTVTVTAPVPRLSRTKFLAFGDSFTAGEVTVPTVARLSTGPNFKLIVVPAAAYPTQLRSRLRARYTAQTALIEVTNAGLPGEWAEDGTIRLPGVLSAFRPEAVLLLHGSNELAALGTPGVQRVWRSIDTMAKEVRNRGGRLFLATLPPPRASGSRALPVSLVQSLNSQIRSTARGEGAVLVDLFDALATDVNRYIGIDGVHPTEAGYARIADTFFAAIRADLERTP